MADNPQRSRYFKCLSSQEWPPFKNHIMCKDCMEIDREGGVMADNPPNQRSAKKGQAARQNLPPKTSRDSETALDPWTATTEKDRSEVFTRAMFLRDLEMATAITNEINSDPDEVRKLRAAISDADAGKARPRRRRATKSDI